MKAWQDGNRLYANAMPVYIIKNLSIHEFWCPQGVLKPIPCGYWGMTAIHNKGMANIHFFDTLNLLVVTSVHKFFEVVIINIMYINFLFSQLTIISIVA